MFRTPHLEPKLAGPDQPVVDVRLIEAEAYCETQLDENGIPGHLPTSEQWKKMAVGPRNFPYGTDDGTLKCGKNANCDADVSFIVGSFAISGFGTYDTVGNVWEWAMVPTTDNGLYTIWYLNENLEKYISEDKRGIFSLTRDVKEDVAIDFTSPMFEKSPVSTEGFQWFSNDLSKHFRWWHYDLFVATIHGGSWDKELDFLDLYSFNNRVRRVDTSSNDIGFRCVWVVPRVRYY